MNYDETRIQESGLDLNIVDLLIFDSIEYYLSRIENQRRWIDTDEGWFCNIDVEMILSFNKYRLSGICNNTKSLLRKLSKLVELGIFDKLPCKNKTLLRQGNNFKLISNRYDMMTGSYYNPPTLEEVKAFFAEKGLKDPDGFFRYNEKRNWRSRNGQVAAVEIWHTWAYSWSEKSAMFDKRRQRAQAVKQPKSVVSNLPKSLTAERYRALGPDYQLRYTETKDRGGNTVYVLKAS